ncbi:MAG: DUF4238 domain-containing protein [Campylobacterota bacterium]|nr:DUF4238 domain-containing protein [Campylobacterota bacterium]
MAEKKWQHIIPNGYLKAWGDKEFKFKTPHVWLYNCESHFPIDKPTSNKIFTEKNYYTIYDTEGIRNLEIEDAFARHEEDFYKIRDEKLFQNKEIYTDEQNKLCIFIAIMLNRTEVGIDYIKNIFVNMNKNIDESLIVRKNNELIDYDRIQQIADTPVEYGLKLFIEEIAPQLTLLDIRVYTTTDKIGFITSDNPCIWHDLKSPLNHFGAGTNSESLNILLPISPNHCIVMKPKINDTILFGYENIDERPELLKEINRLIYSKSYKYYISNSNSFNKEIFCN